MTSRRPCWCLWRKKKPPCWFLKLILRELNSILMQTICFGLSLRQTTALSKILNNLLYSLCFPTIIYCSVLLYPLSFEDFILLFSSAVFSLFLQSPVFVGLRIVLPNDVTAAMLMFRNKERAAMLAPQINPSRIELHLYTNGLFWFGLKTNGHCNSF